ncbi:MAG: 50S ribosomal protein L29 [Rhodocyclaceae bacterium]|jgi:large subunit ribosomal protein L29|nr:50S ribosomal protein L29 [Rhodocyclaceae bacterium]MCE2724231.1 50S ribosomal protein L29 [Betaproteobacteria bacterium]MCA3018680.1 50S ribosomal protein L29 [Rhodocyclaceae bacterium]MCA3023444.1 50S ribosomal protein L29 [Rhodocyclaceae bacterium]MCA3025858.1 50S ribosomal protein L29 [Rhodocyclaceae bacterium]
MNTKEMRAKSPEDLNKELLDLRRAQFSMRMQVATQQMSKTTELGRVKREIAQIKTILTEKAKAQ